MSLKFLFIITLFSFSLTACKQASKTVLVAGDSWNVFTCNYNSLDKAFRTAGMSDVASHASCALTTHFGMQASEWLASSYHKATLTSLKDPSVKVLYLSLGGNDILDLWNRSYNTTQEQVVFEKVKHDLKQIIQIYREARPDIKILITGYDFPRFTPNHPIEAYKKAYEHMGSPTPLEINSVMIRFSESVQKIMDQKSVFYIQHHGLMHYYFGNKEAGLPSLKTLAPEFISPANHPDRAGGDKNLLSDSVSMLQVGPATDAFHLSQFGYEKLADHSVSIYLKEWLK